MVGSQKGTGRYLDRLRIADRGSESVKQKVTNPTNFNRLSSLNE